MVGGIFYEHSHRLLGATVGLLTVVLAIVLWLTEQRQWLRRLGLIALVAVILQGVLGGLRVVLIEQKIAIIHACPGPGVFLPSLPVSAWLTSAEWRADRPESPSGDTKKVQQLGLLTVGLIYGQLILGALFRHTGAGLSLHILGAVAVFIVTFLLVDHVQQYHATQRPLLRSGMLLRWLLLLQVGLGFLTYVVKYLAPSGPLTPQAVLLATSHVIVGAFMLVTSVRFTLRAYRIGRSPEEAASPIFSEQVTV